MTAFVIPPDADDPLELPAELVQAHDRRIIEIAVRMGSSMLDLRNSGTQKTTLSFSGPFSNVETSAKCFLHETDIRYLQSERWKKTVADRSEDEALKAKHAVLERIDQLSRVSLPEQIAFWNRLAAYLEPAPEEPVERETKATGWPDGSKVNFDAELIDTTRLQSYDDLSREERKQEEDSLEHIFRMIKNDEIFKTMGYIKRRMRAVRLAQIDSTWPFDGRFHLGLRTIHFSIRHSSGASRELTPHERTRVLCELYDHVYVGIALGEANAYKLTVGFGSSEFISHCDGELENELHGTWFIEQILE